VDTSPGRRSGLAATALAERALRLSQGRGDIRERTIDGRRPPPVAGEPFSDKACSMVLTAVLFSLPSIAIVCAASAAAASATLQFNADYPGSGVYFVGESLPG
jgi:hypothetical protein